MLQHPQVPQDHAAASTKAPGTWASLGPALQDTEMPPGARDLFLAKYNSPSHQQPISRTGAMCYTRSGKHQPSFWFHTQGQLRPHLSPPASPSLLQTPCAHSQVCFPGSLLNHPQQDCKPAVTKQWHGPCPAARWYPCSCLFPVN